MAAASSSAGGSADLVEHLGVPLDLSADEAVRVAAEVGLTYLFAPRFNPALRHVAVVRRELAVPTAFNARVLRGLVDGEPGPVRDVVLLNAAAALVTLELGSGLLLEQFAECLERCREAVDNGSATATLERWAGHSLACR